MGEFIWPRDIYRALTEGRLDPGIVLAMDLSSWFDHALAARCRELAEILHDEALGDTALSEPVLELWGA